MFSSCKANLNFLVAKPFGQPFLAFRPELRLINFAKTNLSYYRYINKGSKCSVHGKNPLWKTREVFIRFAKCLLLPR